MPPWSTCTESDLIVWIDDLIRCLNSRNRWVHAMAALVATESGWSQIAVQTRTGERFHLDAGAVDDMTKVTNGLADLEKRSVDLLIGLLMRVRDGVYSLHYGHVTESTQTYTYCFPLDGGGWPDRPSPEELTEWWTRVSAESPDEWAQWPPPLEVQRSAKVLDALGAGKSRPQRYRRSDHTGDTDDEGEIHD